jgi:septal ring factor EnvC (AmiA/AmiB activator)
MRTAATPITAEHAAQQNSNAAALVDMVGKLVAERDGRITLQQLDEQIAARRKRLAELNAELAGLRALISKIALGVT